MWYGGGSEDKESVMQWTRRSACVNTVGTSRKSAREIYEAYHDKSSFMHIRSAKAQISISIICFTIDPRLLNDSLSVQRLS